MRPQYADIKTSATDHIERKSHRIRARLFDGEVPAAIRPGPESEHGFGMMKCFIEHQLVVLLAETRIGNFAVSSPVVALGCDDVFSIYVKTRIHM